MKKSLFYFDIKLNFCAGRMRERASDVESSEIVLGSSEAFEEREKM